MYLHDDDGRKRSFGLDAELYDAARHHYPSALVERIVSYAGLGSESRIFEIGSGTGLATLPFAERGFAIECVELREAMANVARAKLAAFPRVRIHVESFEDVASEAAAFDVVMCAQAWHWISPDVRYRRARALLRQTVRSRYLRTGTQRSSSRCRPRTRAIGWSSRAVAFRPLGASAIRLTSR